MERMKAMRSLGRLRSIRWIQSRALRLEVSERSKRATFKGQEYYRKENYLMGSPKRNIIKSLKKVEMLSGPLESEDIILIWKKLAIRDAVEEMIQVAKFAAMREIPVSPKMLGQLLGAMYRREMYADLTNIYEKYSTITDLKTKIIAMKSLGYLHRLNEAIAIYEELIEVDDQDPRIYVGMINAYSKSEKPLDGVKVFEAMKRANVPPSVRSYNSVLHCCHVGRNMNLALEHLGQMRQEKIEPDSVTLGILMDTAVKCGRIDEALQMASAAEGTSSAQSEQFIGTLVSAVVKAGRTNEAKELLRRDWGADLKPSNQAYYTVINSLVREEALTEAVGLFEEMKKRKIPPSAKTYGLLMQSFARKRKGIVCLELAGEMIEGGLQPDGRGHKALVAVAASYDRALEIVRSWNISPLERYMQLLDYCAKRGDAEKVATTLDTIRQSGFGELIDRQDHSIMDKVVMAYANAKKPEEIAEVMEGMEKNGITPSDDAYASLLNLLIRTGNYESGKQLWRHLVKRKEPPAQRVFLMAIKLCMAERRNFQAERAHMRMISIYGPDITAFNTMLLGYARQKYYYREVLMLLEEMKMRGLQPNAMTRRAFFIATIRRRDRILRGRPYTVFCDILERGEAGLREYKLILKHLVDRRFSRVVVEQAQAVIAEMKRRKVQPDSELMLWARVIRRRQSWYQHEQRNKREAEKDAVDQSLKILEEGITEAQKSPEGELSTV
ncbi:hypothetical protein NDN08_002529 [Rhodosorus marinus]|uniref:Pentacotripeptide-repeat region of PRORP domain-containing protein n=1 Tax=Rhodosorus marinus TaxID=101924 RepID=A0AAV8UU04_9RHOD|nr:hypothetical protein NDN08_002529 [Rhodosorus marinus]